MSLYQKLIDGFHVVRRSDRKWAGLSTDLVIEQVLMRSMKTSGGLRKGLRNIMNGVHANDTVNVDDAKDIGQGILAQ